jgi:hypothetical protein
MTQFRIKEATVWSTYHGGYRTVFLPQRKWLGLFWCDEVKGYLRIECETKQKAEKYIQDEKAAKINIYYKVD